MLKNRCTKHVYCPIIRQETRNKNATWLQKASKGTTLSSSRYNKKTTRVPVLSHQTTRVKTYHLSAKREGDEFFYEGGLLTENSNEGGFLFIMNLKI